MKRKMQMVVYVVMMSALIVLSLGAARQSHTNCPVCQHAEWSEGLLAVSSN